MISVHTESRNERSWLTTTSTRSDASALAPSVREGCSLSASEKKEFKSHFSSHKTALRSRWFAGSSSIRRSGFANRARAIATRIRHPPLSCDVGTELRLSVPNPNPRRIFDASTMAFSLPPCNAIASRVAESSCAARTSGSDAGAGAAAPVAAVSDAAAGVPAAVVTVAPAASFAAAAVAAVAAAAVVVADDTRPEDDGDNDDDKSDDDDNDDDEAPTVLRRPTARSIRSSTSAMRPASDPFSSNRPSSFLTASTLLTTSSIATCSSLATFPLAPLCLSARILASIFRSTLSSYAAVISARVALNLKSKLCGTPSLLTPSSSASIVFSSSLSSTAAYKSSLFNSSPRSASLSITICRGVL
mmetsp:Transcript_29731/g.71512  ORF Transcript_29731/g.71512 Transcript_29731/m.71512 type:complete len:360 (-) Transcript_29731:752-1831(-)